MDFEKYTEEQDKERCELVGVNAKNFFGGCAQFQGITYGILKKLVDKGYADPEDNQNGSTTLGEYLEFLRTHPGFRVHGYIVANDRNDRRITVEGLESYDITLNELCDFIALERYADEFEATQSYCRSWWD